MTTTQREVDPRLKALEADESPDEDVSSEERAEREGPGGEDVPVRESAQRRRRAYDSIMDYVPSTTTGQVIRPAPVGKIAVFGVAALLLLGVGVVVALETSPADPTGDLVVHSPSALPLISATSLEAPDDSTAVLDDEVADDEILIIEEDDEAAARGAGGQNGVAARRSEKGRGRKRVGREKPPPGANFVELDRLTVRKTIRSRMVHLHRCYDEALSKNPELAGRLEIEITIGIRGRVTRAAITKDSLHHGATTGCIVAKLEGWRFHLDGWLRRPVEVTFPVSFRG